MTGEPLPFQLFNAALAAQKHGDLAGAEQFYLRAVQLAPGYGDAWNNLGIIAQLRQAQRIALERYIAALQCDPRASAPWANYASLLEQMGRWHEAARFYEHSLRLSERPEILSNLAGVYRELQDFAKARDLYARAIDLAPSHVHIHSALVFTVDQDPSSTLVDRRDVKRRFYERHRL